MSPTRLVVAMTLTCLWGHCAAAQPGKPHAAGQPVVDTVTLAAGKSVRGAIVRANTNGSLTMAVSREWLQHSLPALYQKAIASEEQQQKLAWEQLCDRLKKELASPAREGRLAAYLKQELDRAESLLHKPAQANYQFLWLDLEKETISKINRAAPDAQKIAMWSWGESLANVETREKRDLERELEQRKIDVSTAPPDLADRLPARSQDDREWAARLSIAEHTLGKQVDFQGTGDLLIRVKGERKALDLTPVLKQILQSQVDSLLKDLTNEGRAATSPVKAGAALSAASREADTLAVRSFRATRVDVQPASNQVTVRTDFQSRMPDGRWETIWSYSQTIDAATPRDDLETKIAEDPQVKQVLEAVRSFGIGVDDQIDKAVRFGAATMAAQQAADAAFFTFRDTYLKHLDGPPLFWSK